MKSALNTLDQESEFDCFVISLEDESKRLAQFRARNKPTEIVINHFKAVDGSKLENIGDMRSILGEGAHNWTRGSVGCAMSHLALWKECVSRKRKFVIFEDDAYLRYDFSSQLQGLFERYKDWDLILLGYNTNTIIELGISPGINFAGQFSVPFPNSVHLNEFVRVTDPVALLRLKIAFGLCGYVVTPKGAKLLIEKCLPLDTRAIYIPPESRSIYANGIDVMMVSVYSDMRAYLSCPPLVMTPNDPKTSQIRM
jgi:glycosyl transferase, family 25